MSTKRTGGLDKFQELISNIKRDKVGGSKATALSIANIFTTVIKAETWKDATDLLKIIKQMGSKLSEADPMAFYIGNIVKRIAHIIRVQSKACDIPLFEEKPKNGDDVSLRYLIYRVLKIL